MTASESRAADRDETSDDQASPLELFFDLLFVFALNQLSQSLLGDLTGRGVVETAVLVVAVFSVWSATSFAAVLPEVRRTHAQWLVLAVMLLGLFMNAAIGNAWTDGAWWFVVPYLVCRLGHAIAAVALTPGPGPRAYQAAALGWTVASAPLWVAGAVGDGDVRLWCWVTAAGIDLVGLWAAHPVPARFRYQGDLELDADRLVERCRLFLLVALGETVLSTGLALAKAPQEVLTVVSGSLALTCVIALWLLYFGSSDHHLDRDLSRSSDPVRTARRVMASLVVVVAGLVGLAAGMEEVIAHPDESVKIVVALLLCGGPLLYVLVQAWYLSRVAGGSPTPRLVGAAVLAALVPVALLVPGTAALGLVAAVLAVQALATLRGPGAVG